MSTSCLGTKRNRWPLVWGVVALLLPIGSAFAGPLTNILKAQNRNKPGNKIESKLTLRPFLGGPLLKELPAPPVNHDLVLLEELAKSCAGYQSPVLFETFDIQNDIPVRFPMAVAHMRASQ